MTERSDSLGQIANYQLANAYLQTGNNVDQTFVVDLENLSYYAYNFWDFQVPSGNVTIYFRTPSSAHPYLGVYSVQDTFDRTDGGTGAY